MTAHYCPSAYQPARIPDQPAAVKRSWLFHFGSSRLPWGHTQDIVPHSMLSGTTPAYLRDAERRENALAMGEEQREAYEVLDYHQIIDHERYRYASLSKRSLFWFYLWGGGRFVFWAFLLLLPFPLLMEAYESKSGFFSAFFHAAIESAPLFLAPPLACWAIGSLVVHKLPNWFVHPSKGPLWELNRRTGMVTIFDYDNMGEYQRSGTIGDTNPFYEFDAYISSGPDRQGLIWHQLHLVHRYHDLAIDLSPIVPKDSSMAPHFAAWDFLQNYMDTSRPLPDIPLFEEHRAQDPVTAEHDRHIGRPERYWRDIDDATWDARVMKNLALVNAYDITGRLNLMDRHVRYAD